MSRKFLAPPPPFKKPKHTHPKAPTPSSAPLNHPNKISSIPTSISTATPQMSDTSADPPNPTNASNTNTTTTAATTPAATGPQTPPPNNAFNAAAPGELSPPQSQGGGAPTTNGTAAQQQNGVSSTMANGINNTTVGVAGSSPAFGGTYNAQERLLANNGGGAGDLMSVSSVLGGYAGGGGAQQQEQQQQGGGDSGPGEWKSKKAQDEMQRAWEMVADKDWSAREFGDVVLRGRAARQG